MSLHDATRAQIRAADPSASSWLMANAGSGKTRVLTDRVAWLLLNDAPPERILCLTYTKAAASEMQNRLFTRLGEWAMMDDAALVEALEGMGVPATARGADALARARTLFARAIEAPGGLKIQTIHSFAAALLRRFPLEAGVSPGFQEIDDRARVILMDEVLDALAEGPQADAVAGVARYLGGSGMRGLMSAVQDRREAFAADHDAAAIRALLGVPPGMTAGGLLDETFTGGEDVLCARAAALLDPTTRGNDKIVETLTSFPWAGPSLDDLARIEKPFLFGSDTKTNPDGAKIGKFANKEVRAALGPDLAPLEAFMLRLEAARPVRRALVAAERAEALAAFARAWLPAYDAAKAARGWLDFDDLIVRARALLTDRAIAPWVLFRLDGGIDHLLVDEAQDTSPPQWEIIGALAAEFAAGEGARVDVTRTLFVVGDRKQSIYSFQGADPDGFERMRDHFAERLAGGPAPLGQHELVYSFRSAPPILSLVDRVFAGSAGAGVGQGVRHAAFRDRMPGRIDIWPPVAKAERPEDPPWYDPVDQVADTHHDVRLAERVAGFLKRTLDDPPLIEDRDGPRPLAAGDVLILVRRRGLLFHRLIAEIKAEGLPIPGADKIPVTEQLAVKDLIALMSFLATPADDLSLAAVLRSPVFGLSEDDLYRLAQGRGGTLWHALRESGHAGALEILHDLRDQSDLIRPYELLERVLIRHDARRRIVARLGAEAEDGIDALLAQALAYERVEVPSLTGFLDWLLADELQIKRDPGGRGGQIRVMTVHGAKGLEAPLVILPETARYRPGNTGPRILAPEGGPALWPAGKDEAPPLLRELMDDCAARDAEEENRLLYVALTRAAQWLVVAAAGDLGTEPDHCWYGMIHAAATEEDGVEEIPLWDGIGLRIETGAWRQAGGPADEPALPAANPEVTLPDWALSHAPAAEVERAASPSDLGGAKALPGDPGAADEAASLRRGRLLHLLLEHLPAVAPPAWAGAAPGILSLDGPDLPDEAETDALMSEAAAVLTAPDLAPLFAGEALAEVGLTARSATLGRPLMGQIDRLFVTPDTVRAIDFKSNILVPDTPAEVPEGLLRQMGAYAEMLAAIYPGRRVETAILWTGAARLMVLPDDLVMAALRRAAGP
ncbi:double-strand break repair helicase AddA [Rhodobacterales bacterium HKCCE2091]|nr:double-strand break repair helicase AddA [Rhodobacterales bacterium HKCCE2091]